MFNFRGRKNSGDLKHYATMIEQYLATAKINLSQARLNVENGFGWTFPHGSATIEVYVSHHDEEKEGGFLQVLSPIMHLPSSNLLPLYRRLLELNLQMIDAAMGVYLDVAFVFNERPLIGLNEVEIGNIIQLVATYADELDDQLVREFGGRLYGRV